MNSKRYSEQAISHFLPTDIINEINDGVSFTKTKEQSDCRKNESYSTKCDSSQNVYRIPNRNPISSHLLSFNQMATHEPMFLNRRIVSQNQLKFHNPIMATPMTPMQTMNTFNPYYNNMINLNQSQPQTNVFQSVPFYPNYQPNMNNVNMSNLSGMNMNNMTNMNMNMSNMGNITNMTMSNISNMNGNYIPPRTAKSEKIVFNQLQKNSNANSNFNSNASTDPINNKKPSTKRKYSGNVNTQMDIESILNEMTISQIIEKTGKSFLKLSKTKKGSIYLQNTMKKITNDEIELILKTISDDLIEIMCDYYGNYFFNEFLPRCNTNQRLLILNNIKEGFNHIANDICGTHSLQKLIKLIATKEEEEIIKECLEAEKDLLHFSNDSNSTHIIQKAIIVIQEPNREYINNFIISNIIDLCITQNGICVVKAFIQNNTTDSIIKAIITIFELETAKLTEDQYGNFGIQDAIEKYGETRCGKIIKKIIDHVIRFASQKFSSNVIDFLIRYMNKNNKTKFQVLIDKLFKDENNFLELISNKYGNFVLENAKKYIDISHLNEIKEYWRGKEDVINGKEKNKIDRLLKDLS